MKLRGHVNIPAIRRLVTEALLMFSQSTGTEARIVEALRAEGALALSLVEEEGDE
jgi:putative acetyltransferase